MYPRFWNKTRLFAPHKNDCTTKIGNTIIFFLENLGYAWHTSLVLSRLHDICDI